MYNLMINGTTKQFFYVCVAFQGFLSWGISRAFLSFFFHQLDQPHSIIKIDSIQQSWIASCSTLLSPLGGLGIGICMDKIGRRHSLKLIYLPFIISWMMIARSTNTTVFYIAFLIQGIGVGMCPPIGIYVSEITTPNYRGTLFAIIGITSNIGTLFCNFVMYYLPWNTVALILFIIALLSFILNCLLPESPIWLYLKGDVRKSVHTLCSIRCLTEDQLTTEIKDIEKFCTSQKEVDTKNTFKNCLHSWKQLLIVTSFICLCIGSGYLTMLTFLIQIIRNMKISNQNEEIDVTFSLIAVLTSFTVPYFFHKFARKTILASSGLGMGFSLMIIAICYRLNLTSSFGWTIPTAFYLYCFSANIGVLPLGFIIPGELLPNESRGILNSIIGIFGFLLLSLLQKLFPDCLDTFGVDALIWTFSAFSFLLVIFALYILPETKGKSLNQIQEEYFNKKTVNVN